MPAGLKTTEFWIAIAVLAAGLVLVLHGDLDANTYWQWAAGLAGLYSIGRGISKVTPTFSAPTTVNAPTNVAPGLTPTGEDGSGVAPHGDPTVVPPV